MRTIILSDCHVGPNTNSSSLTRFLSTVSCDQLIFAGDLFDLWEYTPKEISLYCANTIGHIRKLYQKGIKVSYVLGEADADYAKSPLLGPMELPVLGAAADFRTPGGRRVVVVHGHDFDGRHKWFRRMDNCLSWMTDCFRNQSCIDLFGNDRLAAAEDIHAHARKYWSQRGANILVMGHTHCPRRHPVESSLCEFANAGDWLGHSTYVSIDDDNVTVMAMGRV